MNPHDNDDEQDDSYLQDPLAAQQASDAKRAKLERYTKEQVGLTDDECSTLFPTIKSLEDFVNDHKKLSQVNDEDSLDEGETDSAPEDVEDLSESDKRELSAKNTKRAVKDAASKASSRNIRKKSGAKDNKGNEQSDEDPEKATFEDEQKDLPESEKMSWEEYLRDISD